MGYQSKRPSGFGFFPSSVTTNVSWDPTNADVKWPSFIWSLAKSCHFNRVSDCEHYHGWPRTSTAASEHFLRRAGLRGLPPWVRGHQPAVEANHGGIQLLHGLPGVGDSRAWVFLRQLFIHSFTNRSSTSFSYLPWMYHLAVMNRSLRACLFFWYLWYFYCNI